MKQIFFCIVILSVLGFAGFSKSGNIVTDDMTKLEWQDDIKENAMNWKSAIKYCDELSLDGYSDWRLPNLNELNSIVNDSKSSPAIDIAFENIALNGYWSSTSFASYTHYAWTVGFGYGLLSNHNKLHDFYVRCVRAGE